MPHLNYIPNFFVYANINTQNYSKLDFFLGVCVGMTYAMLRCINNANRRDICHYLHH
ncbi:hypothetical protein WI0192307A01_CDS0060 [Salmonella phage VT223]